MKPIIILNLALAITYLPVIAQFIDLLTPNWELLINAGYIGTSFTKRVLNSNNDIIAMNSYTDNEKTTTRSPLKRPTHKATTLSSKPNRIRIDSSQDILDITPLFIDHSSTTRSPFMRPSRRPTTTPVTTTTLRITTKPTTKPTTKSTTISTTKSIVESIVKFKNRPFHYYQCGMVQVGTALSVGSEFSYPGQWPWYAQIFYAEENKFVGGSSIISSKYLLTAAHVFDNKIDPSQVSSCQPKKPHEVFALVGVSEIQDRSEQPNKAAIKRIVLHKSWNHAAGTNYDYDIALAELENEIIFSALIQPVCLPNPYENVYDLKGTIVGHGLTSSSSFLASSKTKHVKISSVRENVCLYRVPFLAIIGSERMFCAGELGKNPCPGDSGGGFYVVKNQKWTILGIVSSYGAGECEEQHFAMYTKIPNYIDWIKENMNK